MKNPTVLIIEDESALARALAMVFERLGAKPTVCASGKQGLQELAAARFDLVVLDIGLPDMNGLKALERINALKPVPPVLVITAHGTLDNAISARKLRAAGYLVKPLDLHELEKMALDILDNELSSPMPKPAESGEAVLLGGAGPEMQKVFVSVAYAATTDAPALITGPTGTGKTLAARAIHNNSRRRNGPFVTLLCGSFPEQLLESELFGHEKNAFTGAETMRPGHLERAAGGTLFLDEITDIPAAAQAKLLRFVEERKFTRVGGRQDILIDLRLIAATNRSLRDEVQAGRFREDLYYRLHVLEVELPPLAGRREDIPLLASFFLGQFAADRELVFSAETLRTLNAHAWPGNVRELRNAMEHAASCCPGRTIQPHHLPKTVRPDPETVSNIDLDGVMRRWVAGQVQAGSTYKEINTEVESSVLKHLMHHFGQKPTLLARALKMNRATLLKKRKEFGLDARPEL